MLVDLGDSSVSPESCRGAGSNGTKSGSGGTDTAGTGGFQQKPIFDVPWSVTTRRQTENSNPAGLVIAEAGLATRVVLRLNGPKPASKRDIDRCSPSPRQAPSGKFGSKCAIPRA